MDDLARTFFEAADGVAGLLEDLETARQWEQPSALDGFTVGGLAAHLQQGVVYIDRLLDGPEPSDAPVVSVGEYLAGMKLEAFDAELPRYLRDMGERSAKHGPAETARRLREALDQLRNRLGSNGLDRLLDMRPALPWAIRLDDRIRLMIVELVVHGDDLAASLGRPGAGLPEAAVGVAIEALVAAARFRHGDDAVIRTLSRQERSTAGVFPVL